ncbi:YslB family protein [Actinomycetes bacterium NPDC127524]
MKKNSPALLETLQNDEFQIPAFGYELIREILLPDILGKDSKQIMYWAGKQLARKFPLNGVDEVIEFFVSAGWGQLEIVKQSKDELEMSLSGEIIDRRLDISHECHFGLETGFLAEQISMIKKFHSEAYEETKRRNKKVAFLVKWDTKDPI